jgi:hypothetical protein
LKANKVNLFVSSVLFVFWYHSPNFLDTPHINYLQPLCCVHNFGLLPVCAQQTTCFCCLCSVFSAFVNHYSLPLPVLYIHPSFPQLFHYTQSVLHFSAIYVVVLISAKLFLSSWEATFLFAPVLLLFSYKAVK